MNDRTLGLLGIARRASALSLGHDAALSSVKEGKASVCILASDSSERLKNEFISFCEKTGGKTPVLRPDGIMAESACGRSVCAHSTSECGGGEIRSGIGYAEKQKGGVSRGEKAEI